MIATISANSIDLNKLAFDGLDRLISFMKFSCVFCIFHWKWILYVHNDNREYNMFTEKILNNR